jgi:hypothetical protein
MTICVGMLSTPKALAIASLSGTTSYLNGSLVRYFFSASAESSAKLTKRTLSPNAETISLSLGRSTRQGGHAMNQKSSTVTRPTSADGSIAAPSRVVPENDGIGRSAGPGEAFRSRNRAIRYSSNPASPPVRATYVFFNSASARGEPRRKASTARASALPPYPRRCHSPASTVRSSAPALSLATSCAMCVSASAPTRSPCAARSLERSAKARDIRRCSSRSKGCGRSASSIALLTSVSASDC